MNRPAPAWIETVHRSDRQRTQWRILVDGEVMQVGELDDDVSGLRAYDIAQRWAHASKLSVAGWKHGIDQPPTQTPLRARTSTDRATALRLFGWAICGNGEGREAVGVSPAQIKELEDGAIPCPTCEEACGASLSPAGDVEPIAFFWTGSRWHHR